MFSSLKPYSMSPQLSEDREMSRSESLMEFYDALDYAASTSASSSEDEVRIADCQVGFILPANWIGNFTSQIRNERKTANLHQNSLPIHRKYEPRLYITIPT